MRCGGLVVATVLALAAWLPLAARASAAPAGHILFTRIWAGFETIWTVAPDGTGESQIVIPPQGNRTQPRFSPDGRKIAYVYNGNVFSAQADGSQARLLTSGGQSTEPAWSPDGTKIAFRNGRGIWVMNADGTAPVQLTYPPGPNPTDVEPAWSPDGTQIAFVRQTDNADGQDRVYRVNVANGDLNPVSIEENAASWPAWTPDGTGIVFAETTPFYTHTGLTRASLSDGTSTPLTSASDDHPAFSPDGTRIAFTRFNQTNSAGFGTYELWGMNADGTGQSHIPTDPTLYGPETPDWGIGPVLPIPPSNTAPPSVPQSEVAGTQVSADPGSWSGSPTSYDYQWSRCRADGTSCADIDPNGTGPQYTPVTADVGRRLKVRVVAHNRDGASAAAESALSGVVQAAAPAATPKQAADDLTQGLARLAQVSQALGGTGPIAKPLWLSTSGPGDRGLLGLGDLFAGATVDRLSNPADLSQLASQLTGTASLSGGRTATVTASVAPAGQPSTVTGLDLTITAAAHPTGLPLKISSSSPALTLTSAQGATGDLTLTTQLALRYDTASREVWLDTSGAPPTVGIDATVAVKPGAKAGVGVLGTALGKHGNDALLASATHLTASFGSPTAGRLSVLKPDVYGDLVPTTVSPASLSAAYDSARASTLAGTVQLTADTSGWAGLAPLAPISGSLAMNDPDVTSGPAPTVTTSGLDDVLSFASVTPSDLLAGLQELSLFLHSAQTTTLPANGGRTVGDIPLPFMLGKLSDTFDARAAIDRFIVAHGQSGSDGGPDFHSIQDMLTELNAADAGNTTVSVDNLTWADATKKLSYGLHVHSAQANVPLDPNEGAQEDPHIGQVDFGKTLVAAAGIDALAAQHATATASPNYHLDVTPVLDLGSSLTGQPISMLRTGGSLLSADVPVSTGVDAGGTAGALNLHAGGKLEVKPPSAGHMLDLSLNQTGDADSDARVSALLSQLGRAPGSVLAAANGGSATADLGLDVPGTPNFFTGANCTNEAVPGCSDASVKQADVSDPSTISVTGSELGTLQAFNLGADRSREMLTKVQSSLLTLAGSIEQLPTLTQGTAGQVLGSPIPMLGTSVGQLIDAKALRAALASLNGKAPATLKDLADALNAALGSGSAITFSTGTGSSGQPVLLAHVVQHEQVNRDVPLDLSRGPGEAGLIGVSSSGNLHLTGSVDVDVTVAVDISAAGGADSASTLSVMPGSKVVAKLKVDGSGTISGTFGPYQARLGDVNDPSVVHVAVDLELSDPSPGNDAIPFSQWASGLTVALNHNSSPVHCTSADANLTLDVCAALPLYLSHDGGQTYNKVSDTGNNNFNVRLPADDPTFDVLGDPIPDPNGGSHDRLESPDGLAAALAGALLDFSTVKAGADKFFGLVENGLQAAAGGGGLPIVGSDLEEGHKFVEDLQGQVDGAFDAIGPLEGLSSGGLAQTIHDRLTQALGSTLRNQVQVTLTCSAGPCNGSEPATQVVKAAVQFDVGSASGDLSKCQDPNAGCLGFSTPLNLGLPGLSLTGDNLSGGVGWNLHVAFGLDKNGFFAEPGNQLKLGLGLRAPQNLTATLGFLHVRISDLSGGAKPTFAGTVSVGLNNGQDAYIVNLGPGVIDANLSAQADADWHVEATADSALPGIAADFHLHWSLTNPDANPSLIRFDNIGVVPGSIVQGALGPIARTLYNVMSPVRPILDAMSAPIPVLDWLAEHAGLQPPTVLSLLGVAGDVSHDTRVSMIYRAAAIANIVKNITSATANNNPIPLGAFDVDPAGAVAGQAPSTEMKNVQVDPAASGSDFKSTLLNAAFPASQDASLLNDFLDQNSSGFTFPAFDDPKKLMGLLLGQDVDIAHYDAGTVEAHLGGPVAGGDFSLDVAPVDVGAYAQADIKAQFQAGFDTYGIRKAISKGSPGEVFNGLYISTVDSMGKETPNLDLSGQIGLFAKAGIPGASIGVDGGIRLHTSLKIRDVNKDHKFRPSDLGRLSQGAGCVFGATFDSNAFLKITGSLGFGPASVSTDFVDIEQPLWDFNSDCPATAGESDDTTAGGWAQYHPNTPLGTAVAIGGTAAALNDAGDVLASDGGGDFIRSGADGTRQDLGALGEPQDLNNAGEALFLQSNGFSTPHLVIREPDGRKVTIPQPNVTGRAFISQPGPGACNSLVYGEAADGLFIADATSSQLLPDTVPIGSGHVDRIHMLGGNSSGLALAGTSETGYVWEDGQWVDLNRLLGNPRGTVIEPIDVTEAGDVLVYGAVGGDPAAGGTVLVHVPGGGYTVLSSGRRATGVNDHGDLSLTQASAYHAGTSFDLAQRIDPTLEEVHAPNNNGQFLGTTHYVPPTGGVVSDGGPPVAEHRDDVLVTVPSWQNQPAKEAKGPGCQPPAAPQNPDAFATDAGHVQITWDPPDNSRGVTGYRLYESPANYSHVDPIGEVGPGTFELTVAGDPKSGAHYLIRAIGLGGESHAVVAIAASGVGAQRVGPTDDVFMSLPGLGDLDASPGLVSSPVTIKFRSPATDGGGSNAGAGDFQLLGQTFSLTATDDNGDPVHQFGENYLLSLHYDPAQLPPNTTASAIKLYFYDTARATWRSIAPCTNCLLPGAPNPDTSTHTVVFALDHMTRFALGVPASPPGNPPPPGGGTPSGSPGGGSPGGGTPSGGNPGGGGTPAGGNPSGGTPGTLGFFGLKPAAASGFDYSGLHKRRSFALKLANRNPVPTTTAVVLKVQLRQRAGKRYVTRTLVLARATVVAAANQVKPLTLTLTRASVAKLHAARGLKFTLALSTSAAGYPVSSATVPVRLPVARLP